MPNYIKHCVKIVFPTTEERQEFKKKTGKTGAAFSFCSLFNIINESAPNCHSSKIVKEKDNMITYKFKTNWYPFFDYYLTLGNLYENVKFYVQYNDEGIELGNVSFYFTLNVDVIQTELERIQILRSQYPQNRQIGCTQFLLHLKSFKDKFRL